MALRFSLGKSNAERLCEKVDGQCTGKSTAPWQYEQGAYTNECPRKLIEEWRHHLTFWNICSTLGMPQSGKGGWLDEGVLFVRLYMLMENEARHMRQMNG